LSRKDVSKKDKVGGGRSVGKETFFPSADQVGPDSQKSEEQKMNSPYCLRPIRLALARTNLKGHNHRNLGAEYPLYASLHSSYNTGHVLQETKAHRKYSSG
jgi:hypothetical protein